MTASREEILAAEEASWLIDDPERQAEKLRRERMRHYKLARDLLLDKLGTANMSILEVGGGPLPLSDILQFRNRLVVDPLTNVYKKIAPCRDHVALDAEDIDERSWRFDLAIATNSLDHVRDPHLVVEKIVRVLRPSGYFAIACAENNAFTHPHPAHEHSLTARDLHSWLDGRFETVWELTYEEHGFRYGWMPHEGRCGQPAFALLMRKAIGY